jgi:hypothetical protein
MPDRLCLLDFSQAGKILILLLLVSCASIYFVILNIHTFLARSAPISADILVVEGWLPDHAIEAAMHEFRKGSYRQIVTIGGSIQRGSYLFPYKTFAELAAASLTNMGLDSKEILVIPFNSTNVNRTYDSATSLKDYLLSQNIEIDSLNLLTLGTHSRRSWILFKKTFKHQVKVGVIAVEPLHYDPHKWWKSSEGSRTILSECIAYLYTRIFILNTFNIHKQKIEGDS